MGQLKFRLEVPRSWQLWLVLAFVPTWNSESSCAPYPSIGDVQTWCGWSVVVLTHFFLVVKGPAADATDAPQPWGLLCNPVMKMTMIIIFCPFPSSGAPVEWNWQVKTEVLGEKPVPVPLCPPQIPHGLTQHRTQASEVGDRRLTAWAMARPS
jgi:hypothetical protein